MTEVDKDWSMDRGWAAKISRTISDRDSPTSFRWMTKPAKIEWIFLISSSPVNSWPDRKIIFVKGIVLEKPKQIALPPSHRQLICLAHSTLLYEQHDVVLLISSHKRSPSEDADAVKPSMGSHPQRREPQPCPDWLGAERLHYITMGPAGCRVLDCILSPFSCFDSIDLMGDLRDPGASSSVGPVGLVKVCFHSANVLVTGFSEG